MATVTGARGTTIIAAGQRKIDMSKGIKLLQPEDTPFTTFLMELRKAKTGNPEFKSTEDELEPRFDTINGTTGTGTAITVTNGAYFAEHDLVRATRTGELMRVVSVAGNVITVVRGITDAAVASANADELLIIGSAQPEGDTSKPARSSNPTSRTNYTQIQRTPWELTNTALGSENETDPHDWDLQAKKFGIEHKRSLERALWFGKPSENTSGSQARRTTGGFFYYATQNSTDAAGALTEAEFNTAMRSIFRYGTKRKVAFASPLAVSVLNTFPASKVQLQQNTKVYGVDVTTFVSPFGSVRLVPNWEFEGTLYGGYIAFVDMENVRYRYLANSKLNRDSHISTNIQAPDADTRKDEWKTEFGLELNLPKTHGTITGITG